jgi:hypothetical protein
LKQALKIVGPGSPPAGTALVYIQDEIDKFGVAAVRAAAYVCAGADCHVPMIPVISQETFKERERAHTPYFRCLRTNKHVSGCQGDATRKPVSAVDRHGEPSSRPRLSEADRRRIPARWRDGADAFEEGVPVKSGKPRASKSAAGGSTGSSVVRRRTSTAEENTVRGLSHFWRNYQPEIQQFPIQMPGSKAANWGAPFWDVLGGHRHIPGPADRHVYFGPVKKVAAFRGTARLIYFDASIGRGAKLCVWVPDDLGPPAAAAEIKKRIDLATEHNPVYVYVLGTMSFMRGRFTVEVSSANHLWVEEAEFGVCTRQRLLFSSAQRPTPSAAAHR